MANEKIPWDDLEATSVPEVEAGNIENRTLNDEKTYTTSDSRILDFIENGIEVAQPEETKPDDMQLYSGAPSKNWETHSYYSDISDSGKLSLETEGRVENYDPAGEPDGSTILGEGNLTREKFDGDNSVKKPTDWVTAGREPEWEYKYWEFKESYAFDSAKAAGEYLNDQPEWHTIDLGKITVEGYEPEENYNDCDEFIHDLKFYYINKYFDIPNGKEFSDTVIGFYFETEDAAKEELDYSNVAIVCKKGIHIFQKNVEGKYEDQFLRGGHTNYDSEIIKFVTDKNNFETPLDPTSEFWIKNVTKEVDLSQQDGQGIGTTHTPHTLGIKSGTEENVFQNAATFRFHDSRVEALAKQTYEQVDELLYNDSILERTIYDENKRAVVREAEIDTRLSKEIARAQYEEKRIEARATEVIEIWEEQENEDEEIIGRALYTKEELEAFMNAGKVLTYKGHLIIGKCAHSNREYLYYFDYYDDYYLQTGEETDEEATYDIFIQKHLCFYKDSKTQFLSRQTKYDTFLETIELTNLTSNLLYFMYKQPDKFMGEETLHKEASHLVIPKISLNTLITLVKTSRSGFTIFGEPVQISTSDNKVYVKWFNFSPEYVSSKDDGSNYVRIYDIVFDNIEEEYSPTMSSMLWGYFRTEPTILQINRLYNQDLETLNEEKSEIYYPSVKETIDFVKRKINSKPPKIYFLAPYMVPNSRTTKNPVVNGVPVAEKVTEYFNIPVNDSSVYFFSNAFFDLSEEVEEDTKKYWQYIYRIENKVDESGNEVLGADGLNIKESWWERVNIFDLNADGEFLTTNNLYKGQLDGSGIAQISDLNGEILDFNEDGEYLNVGSMSFREIFEKINNGANLTFKGQRVASVSYLNTSSSDGLRIDNDWLVIYVFNTLDSNTTYIQGYEYGGFADNKYRVGPSHEQLIQLNENYTPSKAYNFYSTGIPCAIVIDGEVRKVTQASKIGSEYIYTCMGIEKVQIDNADYEQIVWYNYSDTTSNRFVAFNKTKMKIYNSSKPDALRDNEIQTKATLIDFIKDLDRRIVDCTQLDPNCAVTTYTVNGEAIIPKVYQNTDSEEDIQEAAALDMIEELIEGDE